MSINTAISIIFLLQFTLAIIFRFDPPDPRQTPQQAINGQLPNLVRRRFRNQAQLETPIIQFCSQYSSQNQSCNKCYDGFIFKNQKCIVDPQFNPKNQLKNVQYMRSSTPSKTNQDKDLIIPSNNPFCTSFTPNKALCLSCHKGFKLDDGTCIQNEDDFTLAEQLYLRPIQVPKHTFCKAFNQNGECIECYAGSTYNGSQCVITPIHRLDCRLHQMCVPESTECLTYSSEGLCKSCSREAININGICRINKPQSLCQQIGSDGKCKSCSKFASYFDGICKFKTPNCLEYNADGTCHTCIPTFRRINGECVRPSKIMFVNSDPNCATWRFGECIQCQFGFGFFRGYCLDLQQIREAGHEPQSEEKQKLQK